MPYKIDTKFKKMPIKCKVGAAGTSGRVHFPKELIGRNVDFAHITEQKGE